MTAEEALKITLDGGDLPHPFTPTEKIRNSRGERYCTLCGGREPYAAHDERLERRPGFTDRGSRQRVIHQRCGGTFKALYYRGPRPRQQFLPAPAVMCDRCNKIKKVDGELVFPK